MMVAWSLAAFGCVFVYLQVGYWLGRLHWRVWHINERKNRVATFLLFPFSVGEAMLLSKDGSFSTTDTPHVSGYTADKKRTYLGIKAASWPISLLISLGGAAIIAACFAAYCLWRAGVVIVKKTGWLFSAIWFCMTEGPAALIDRLMGWHPGPIVAPADEPETIESSDEAPPTLLSGRDPKTERSERHRVLVEKRIALDVEIAAVEAEHAAASPAAYRETPIERRAWLDTDAPCAPDHVPLPIRGEELVALQELFDTDQDHKKDAEGNKT